MAMSMPEQAQDRRRTLAQRLDHLFQEIHPAGRGPFSYHEVAQAIREQAGPDGPTVSHGTLQQIRTGAKTNPTVKTLEAIATFFGVPTAYFLDDTVADRVDARVRELKAGVAPPSAAGSAKSAAKAATPADELADVLADSNIRAVAFRLAGLSPRALKGLRAIVDQVREVEGLPEVGRARRGRDRIA
ncbi:helix-turn-helix transcriptional regulator [Kitasatospora sp. GAS204B]|uniref:helix-turn-helix domain-containing protein n=1 Tax=unclassified Kitasatospora TaxID=2633591 RepID=UPI0024732EB2|nr:helix-turn-helix transcriptional regulator [Kitasatospora sp. GAS204B]MDH6119518.1 transcriptional regulator with XRE-family HTH domain [Kitasatospora sp. GAS204B]